MRTPSVVVSTGSPAPSLASSRTAQTRNGSPTPLSACSPRSSNAPLPTSAPASGPSPRPVFRPAPPARDARGDVDGAAVDVAVFADDVAGVDAEVQGEARVGALARAGEGGLDRLAGAMVNTARTPSPRSLPSIGVPLLRRIAALRVASSSRALSRKALSPRRSVSAVDSAMSAIEDDGGTAGREARQRSVADAEELCDRVQDAVRVARGTELPIRLRLA